MVFAPNAMIHAQNALVLALVAVNHIAAHHIITIIQVLIGHIAAHAALHVVIALHIQLALAAMKDTIWMELHVRNANHHANHALELENAKHVQMVIT